MTQIIDSAFVTKDVVVGGGTFKQPSEQKAIGAGNDLLNGSVDIDGVVHVGAEAFNKGESTLMVATSRQQKGSRAMKVIGNADIYGNGEYVLHVGGNAYFDFGDIGDLQSRFDSADARPKPFDIQHPTKGEGNRLRYACIEGPEVAVYCRGRLRNQTQIALPYYWKDLVNTQSISVQIQPIRAHQDIICLLYTSDAADE